MAAAFSTEVQPPSSVTIFALNLPLVSLRLGGGLDQPCLHPAFQDASLVVDTGYLRAALFTGILDLAAQILASTDGTCTLTCCHSWAKQSVTWRCVILPPRRPEPLIGCSAMQKNWLSRRSGRQWKIGEAVVSQFAVTCELNFVFFICVPMKPQWFWLCAKLLYRKSQFFDL